MTPQRGEIWRVALGSEIRKTRPCVIISVNILNERRKTVIVVPLSSSPSASPPILVPVNCEGRKMVAVTDQIRAVAKERLVSRLGVLGDQELAAVEDGLREIFSLG